MKYHPDSLNASSSSRALNLLLALALVLAVIPNRPVKAGPIHYQTDEVAEAQRVVTAAKQTAVEADRLRLSIEGLATEIRSRTAGNELNPEAIGNISAVKRTVDRIHSANVLGEFNSAQTSLDAATKKLGEVQTSLAAVAPQTDETKGASQQVRSATRGAADAKEKLMQAKAGLGGALAGVYAYVKGVATRADASLASLRKEDTPPADLLLLLQRDLPKLSAILTQLNEFSDGWDALAASLRAADLKEISGDTGGTAETETANAVNALRTSAATAAAGMEARMKTLADFARSRGAAVTNAIEQFKQDPAANARSARKLAKEGTLAVADMDRVGQTWELIAAQLNRKPVEGVNAEQIGAASSAREEMFDAARNLSQSVSTLQASMGGDFSQFVTDKVRLYYFTDIPRLIKTLNDAAFIKGGDPAAQARAAEEFQKLLGIEGDLREAEAEQAKFRDRQVALQRQLDQASQDLSAANFLKLAATRRFDELNRRPEGTVSEERKKRAEEEKNLRENDANRAQQRFDELNDEQAGLPAKIREARERRDEAQTELERLSSRLSVTAQNESAAFARARDNAPFWFASPDATNPDPLKRVELSSSTGGDNTITIRGAREDVDKVKEYIAVLDEPAPQARMTLWKLELSSDASNEGTKRFNEALRIVEDELADTRGKIAGAVSLLLDTVNEEANYAAEAERNNIADITDARYTIYAQRVLRELGVVPGARGGVMNPRAVGLKDPGKATTLNEALLVLLMSRRGSRQNILYRLERRMPDRLLATMSSEKERRERPGPRGARWFARLYNMMGDDLDYGQKPCKPNPADQTCPLDSDNGPCPPGYHRDPCSPSAEIELTRPQGEMVFALKFRAVQRILPLAPDLDDWLSKFRGTYTIALEEFQKATRDSTAKAQARARLNKIEEDFPLFGIITKDCGLDPKDFMERYRTVRVDEAQSKRDLIVLNFIRNDGGVVPCRLAFSSARIAAADGMLDTFTKAIEDDLDREVVQPMLDRLRARLRSKGIGVGVVQRTSVLATNRLIARVDPRATAELSLGEETNILQAVQQLAQLTLAAQTGGGLGALSTLRAQAGQERPPEVFGLTTGNTFQVTPIFDPTGQGLRFRFDFVGMTRIREPNDSTDPRLPRIERHTVNTEVQLSNLEIREVSRFDSNARLGQPTRIWGGLPILKDIPGLRQIPIIGWFVKKTGKAAVTQQSLIFAQTTMSPTIGDILNLSDDTRIQP